jgi:prevent-host-death family protein
MSVYTIAQAKDQLSKLVNEAIAGEDVTIARHGKPVVELRPARPAAVGRHSPELIDKVAARAKTLPVLGESAVDYHPPDARRLSVMSTSTRLCSLRRSSKNSGPSRLARG